MRPMYAVLLLGLSACASSGQAPAAAPRTAQGSSLRSFIDSLVDVPDFRSANWGVLVVDPGRGETLYARNADKLFMPASNMKIVTGATALAQLGADYRWTTSVLARGTVTGGVLDGDLTIRGTGDPSVSTHMQMGDALAPLRAMADSLRARGITHVKGRLVADRSAFTDSPLGYGWSWSDLDDAYSAGVDALYFNEGFTEVVVHGGAHAGDAVTATTRPMPAYPSLIVRARTAPALSHVSTAADSAAWHAIAVSQDSSHAGVLVAGAIAPGDSVMLTIAFRDQAAAYLAALHQAFASQGIIVDDDVTAAGRAAALPLTPVFDVRSPALRDVLPFFEKPSQNQIGELLFKTLAREKTGVGRADSAAKLVGRQLVAWGAAADGFAVRDGSGLSRHDYLSPRTIIHVLDAIRTHADFKLFYDALPVAGIDGTIGNRMKGTAAQGTVHAKTGTLDKARALSGYVTTPDGRTLLFSALCNNYTVPTRRVDIVADAIAARLASLHLEP